MTRSGNGRRKSRVAERQIQPFGIEPGEPPSAVVGAKKLGRIEPDGFSVIRVHMRDRAGFGPIRFSAPEMSVMTSAAFKSAARAKPALR